MKAICMMPTVGPGRMRSLDSDKENEGLILCDDNMRVERGEIGGEEGRR